MEKPKEKKNRNEYMREYRRKNPKKMAEINARYYAKKIKEWERQQAEQQAVNE